MAEVVDNYEFRRPGGPGRPEIHPWDEWLNGQTWRIRRGVDFDCKIESFTKMIYRAAKLRDKRAHVNSKGDEIVLKAY